MLQELDDYNWAEVFGEGGGGNCTPIIPNAYPGSKISTKTFMREDVKLIAGMSDGERDERSWIVYGKLRDGRWFAARGSCDYTGWDCRAHNNGDVASTKKEIQRFGLDKEERARLGISLDEDKTSS